MEPDSNPLKKDFVMAESVVFWNGRRSLSAPHTELSLASKRQERRLLLVKQAAFLSRSRKTGSLACFG